MFKLSLCHVMVQWHERKRKGGKQLTEINGTKGVISDAMTITYRYADIMRLYIYVVFR